MSEPLKDNEFKCSLCGGIFEKDWTDEESWEEAEEIWGKERVKHKGDFDVICDGCFKRMMSFWPPSRVRK